MAHSARSIEAQPPTRPRYFRYFTPSLGLLLGGYLFFSKTFAYVHIPGTPVFIGEVVIAIGVVEVLRMPSPWRRLLRTSPVLKFTLLFVAICFVRLLRDFPVYRLDAIRDSSIWYYSVFAFLVAAACLREPTFASRLLGWYRQVIPVFLVWAPIAVLLSDVSALSAIKVPGTPTGINEFKPGDFSVQVAMAVGFLWLGADRVVDRPRTTRATLLALSLVGLVTLLICGTQSRGGFLAGMTTLTVTVAYLPQGRRRHLAFSVGGGLLGVIIVVLLLDIRLAGAGREVSLSQVAMNLSSVVAQDNPQLSGTIDWREQLWKRARDDVLNSGKWATGVGFGPNLGKRYGVPGLNNEAPLRSVHNSHLTIFVRTGVFGVGLWMLLWLAGCFQLHRWIRRRPGGVRDPEVALGAWLLAAIPGLLLNAYFDPSLDGPQASIGLYCLLGLAVATVRNRATPSGAQ